MDGAPFARISGWTVAGPLLWAVHFGGVYGLASLACPWRVEHQGGAVAGWETVPLAVAVLTGVAVLACMAVALAAAYRRIHAVEMLKPDGLASFIRGAIVGLAGLSAVAIAWTGVPAVVLRSCI